MISSCCGFEEPITNTVQVRYHRRLKLAGDRGNIRIEQTEADQGLSEALQEGLQQGLEQGLRQGRQEGDLALALRLLTQRLYTVEPELRSQTQQLSTTQVEELGEALLDFSTTEDLVV